MIKINLIGKRRRETKGKNWLRVIGSTIYISFLVYFLVSVIYVVYKLSSLNSRLSSVQREAELVSSEILANNASLNKYVLSKFILGKVQSLNQSRFKYKDYLDQVASLVPPGATLKSVDFSVTGWVSALISADDLRSLKVVEENIANESFLNGSAFSAIYSENVSKDILGDFNLKLQLEIRKNGG